MTDLGSRAGRSQGARQDEEPVPERRRRVRLRALPLRRARVQVLHCDLRCQSRTGMSHTACVGEGVGLADRAAEVAVN